MRFKRWAGRFWLAVLAPSGPIILAPLPCPAHGQCSSRIGRMVTLARVWSGSGSGIRTGGRVFRVGEVGVCPRLTPPHSGTCAYQLIEQDRGPIRVGKGLRCRSGAYPQREVSPSPRVLPRSSCAMPEPERDNLGSRGEDICSAPLAPELRWSGAVPARRVCAGVSRCRAEGRSIKRGSLRFRSALLFKR